MATEFAFFVGLDWGTESHQICVMDLEGKIICEKSVEHSGEAINTFLCFLDTLTRMPPAQIAIAIEVPRGPVVESQLCRFRGEPETTRSISRPAYGCRGERRSSGRICGG